MATLFPRLAARYGEDKVLWRMAEAGISSNALQKMTVAARHAIGQKLRLALQTKGAARAQCTEMLHDTYAVHTGTVTSSAVLERNEESSL